VQVRRPPKAFNSVLAPVVLVSVLMMVTVVTVIGVRIESIDAVGMRSLLFNQTGIVAAIGMADVVGITKIAISKENGPLGGPFFYAVQRPRALTYSKVGYERLAFVVSAFSISLLRSFPTTFSKNSM
jgi:hypothetical protein